MGDFRNHYCSKWSKAVEYVQHELRMVSKKWIFRGQEKSSWGLKSPLERVCKGFGVKWDQIPEVETRLLREFQRKSYQYISDPPQIEDTLEWLALMRHYGAPTRLLDWTYSFYVAAFFALEKADTLEDSAVWAINEKWCEREARRILGQRALRLFSPLKRRSYVQWSQQHFDDFKALYLSPRPVKFVFEENPFRLNERLTIQQGLFLCPGDVTAPFEDNLKTFPGYTLEKHIVKITLRPCVREEGLDQLYRMNMTNTTLYPGLEGFAQSLNLRVPFFRNQLKQSRTD